MVQLQRATEQSHPLIDKVAVTEVQVVGARPPRITVQWRLSDQPQTRWIEAFGQSIDEAGGFGPHVPTAYGQPMVMRDATIVWCMFEADAQRAATFVDRVVNRTNSRLVGSGDQNPESVA